MTPPDKLGKVFVLLGKLLVIGVIFLFVVAVFGGALLLGRNIYIAFVGG